VGYNNNSIAVTNSYVELVDASSSIYYSGGNMRPKVTNTVSFGGPTNRFNEIHCTAFWAAGTQRYDTLDDLDTLHSIKTLPDGKLDLTSLPANFNYFTKAKTKLREDNGELLTDTEIDEMLQDPEDMGHMLALNMVDYTSLIEGAVRQLDVEYSNLVQQLANWINMVDLRLKAIETNTPTIQSLVDRIVALENRP